MPDSTDTVCFIDSNIWLYAFVKSNDTEKTSTASRLIQEVTPVISTQVINEVCINLLRKADFSEEQIRSLIDSFYETYRVIQMSRAIMENASHLRERYALSFWDSNIVSAALEANVTVLYSEDMHDGLFVNDRLRIINPLK
ncbi:MAG: PIN domain-containing protein [Caldilineaceae bacterium]|nr:PIN domain-containing protein [Caldilineaceae bacterium]